MLQIRGKKEVRPPKCCKIQLTWQLPAPKQGKRTGGDRTQIQKRETTSENSSGPSFFFCADKQIVGFWKLVDAPDP